MTAETARLAVLLRRTQWLIDDLAHEVGSGSLGKSELATAAAALAEVSKLLHDTSLDQEPLG